MILRQKSIVRISLDEIVVTCVGGDTDVISLERGDLIGDDLAFTPKLQDTNRKTMTYFHRR